MARFRVIVIVKKEKKKRKKERKIERSSRAFNDDLILRSATLWRSRASIRRSHSLGKFGILAVSSFEKKAWRSLRPDLATLLLLQFYGWYRVRCTREGTDERFTIMEMFVPTTGKMLRWDQFRSCPDVTAYSILGFDIFPGSYVFEKYFYIRVILLSSIFLLIFRERVKSGRGEINKDRWNFLQFYLLESLNFNIELKKCWNHRFTFELWREKRRNFYNIP